MATFINVGLLDLEAYPQADALFSEYGPVFVEIDDGDESLPRALDWDEMYTAELLVSQAIEDGLYVRVATSNEDAAVFRAAGWQERAGYWSGELLFVCGDG